MHKERHNGSGSIRPPGAGCHLALTLTFRGPGVCFAQSVHNPALAAIRCPGLQHPPPPVADEVAHCCDLRASSEEWAMGAPWPLRAAPRCLSSSHRRSFFMNQRWNRRAVLALVLVAILVAPFGQLGRVAGAQEATPAGAQTGTVNAEPATPVPGAQTWHVLVDKVSTNGENWSFNTFYPDHLRVHPGDTIVFTLAPNPQAFHTVHLLALGMTPLEFYSGFSGGFIKPDLARPGGWQRTYFGFQAGTPCGRAGQHTCVTTDITDDISFGVASPVLVNPPAGGGEGNTSYTAAIDPATRPGPYYVMSDVDGPTMIGRIDVVPADQPVQAASELEEAARQQYDADLAWLAGLDRIDFPPEASNLDGTKIWQVAAGGGPIMAPGSAWAGSGS